MTNNRNDIVGNTYGDLTVIDFYEIRKNRSFWLCKCSCGEEIIRRSDSLKDNSTCPKCKARKQRERMIVHNETKTKIYAEWQGMKARCYRTKDRCFNRYGGRNIRVCDEWLNDYCKFKEYVSQLPNFGKKGYSLDRIDNNGNYEPNNVRWADGKTQSNNKENTILLELNGVKKPLMYWAVELKIKSTTLRNRYYKGWSDYEILTTPTNR